MKDFKVDDEVLVMCGSGSEAKRINGKLASIFIPLSKGLYVIKHRSRAGSCLYFTVPEDELTKVAKEDYPELFI